MRKTENRKLPLGKPHTNHCYKQELSMDAKISGQKCGEKQNVCIVSKYLPKRDLLITTGKIKVNFYSGTTYYLNKMIKANITRDTGIMYP